MLATRAGCSSALRMAQISSLPAGRRVTEYASGFRTAEVAFGGMVPIWTDSPFLTSQTKRRSVSAGATVIHDRNALGALAFGQDNLGAARAESPLFPAASSSSNVTHAGPIPTF